MRKPEASHLPQWTFFRKSTIADYQWIQCLIIIARVSACDILMWFSRGFQYPLRTLGEIEVAFSLLRSEALKHEIGIWTWYCAISSMIFKTCYVLWEVISFTFLLMSLTFTGRRILNDSVRNFIEHYFNLRKSLLDVDVTKLDVPTSSCNREGYYALCRLAWCFLLDLDAMMKSSEIKWNWRPADGSPA